MKFSALILRTHGGLGNQIFQHFYGRSAQISSGVPLYVCHDDRYKHKYAMIAELGKSYQSPSGVRNFISKLRFPKLIKKINGKCERVILNNAMYLDGYFQDWSQYLSFTANSLHKSFILLKKDLAIDSPPNVDTTLYHIRLGDFYSTRNLAKDYCFHRLSKIPKDAHIITNDETMLSTPPFAEIVYKKNFLVLKTAFLDPICLIQLMASYSSIESNGSTLALWASLLSGSNLSIQHQNLTLFYENARKTLSFYPCQG